MPTIALQGINLYYEEYGRGTPISLVHGFAGTTRMWQPQVQALSQDYRLILHDIRGHGGTDAPESPAAYSLDILVADWRQLLERLEAIPAIVGGLSLGGYLALHLYYQHPEVVRALILADTGPGYRNPQRAAEWNKTRLACARILEEGGMEAFMQSEYAAGDYYTPPEIMRTLNPIGLANISKTVMINPWGIDRLGEIQVPSLILCGERDTAFHAATDLMARSIPNARKVIIPGAGHGANVDNPARFNAAVLDFLKEIGA